MSFRIPNLINIPISLAKKSSLSNLQAQIDMKGFRVQRMLTDLVKGITNILSVHPERIKCWVIALTRVLTNPWILCSVRELGTGEKKCGNSMGYIYLFVISVCEQWFSTVKRVINREATMPGDLKQKVLGYLFSLPLLYHLRMRSKKIMANFVKNLRDTRRDEWQGWLCLPVRTVTSYPQGQLTLPKINVAAQPCPELYSFSYFLSHFISFYYTYIFFFFFLSFCMLFQLIHQSRAAI